jgi:hypothetical protein
MILGDLGKLIRSRVDCQYASDKSAIIIVIIIMLVYTFSPKPMFRCIVSQQQIEFVQQKPQNTHDRVSARS